MVHFIDKHPERLAVNIEKPCTVLDLKRNLGDQCRIETDRLILCEIYNSSFYQKFNDDEEISSVKENVDLHAYVLLKPLQVQNHATHEDGVSTNPDEGNGIIDKDNLNYDFFLLWPRMLPTKNCILRSLWDCLTAFWRYQILNFHWKVRSKSMSGIVVTTKDHDVPGLYLI